MSRGATGTNNIPLGYNRLAQRDGVADTSHAPPPPPPPPTSSHRSRHDTDEGYLARVQANQGYSDRSRDHRSYNDHQRSYGGSRFDVSNSSYGGESTESSKRTLADTDDGRGRKRKSRWATADEKAAVPGMPTALAGTVPKEKLDLFLTYVRLEEIGRKLTSGDYVPREKRSPSPEPVYGTDGKRINTREFRYRKKLEDERHKLVQQAQKMDPQFVPPVDYQRPRKAVEKLYIPVRDYPDINFIGLIIGPRGNTLKKMESESKAKISIRGKGSVKEGKVPTANDGLEEDLHCLISADAPEKVAKAIKLIEKIIETAVSIPEAQNDLKRAQLRELASLNGTLRDDENQPCLNCGQTGHRRYECPEQRNFTANLVCRICGGAGHAARDCRDRNNPDAQQKNQKLDAEYHNLMAELGESTDASGNATGHYGPGAGQAAGASGASGGLPPWAAQNRYGGGGSRQEDGYGRGSGGSGGSGNSSLPPWQQQQQHPHQGRGRGGHHYNNQSNYYYQQEYDYYNYYNNGYYGQTTGEDGTAQAQQAQQQYGATGAPQQPWHTNDASYNYGTSGVEGDSNNTTAAVAGGEAGVTNQYNQEYPTQDAANYPPPPPPPPVSSDYPPPPPPPPSDYPPPPPPPPTGGY